MTHVRPLIATLFVTVLIGRVPSARSQSPPSWLSSLAQVFLPLFSNPDSSSPVTTPKTVSQTDNVTTKPVFLTGNVTPKPASQSDNLTTTPASLIGSVTPKPVSQSDSLTSTPVSLIDGVTTKPVSQSDSLTTTPVSLIGSVTLKPVSQSDNATSKPVTVIGDVTPQPVSLTNNVSSKPDLFINSVTLNNTSLTIHVTPNPVSLTNDKWSEDASVDRDALFLNPQIFKEVEQPKTNSSKNETSIPEIDVLDKASNKSDKPLTRNYTVDDFNPDVVIGQLECDNCTINVQQQRLQEPHLTPHEATSHDAQSLDNQIREAQTQVALEKAREKGLSAIMKPKLVETDWTL